MTAGRQFITWQPVLTDHQAYTYQALAQVAGVPVVSFVATMEDVTRKAQGWEETKVNALERRLIPKHGFLFFCFEQLKKYRADIHLFGSPFQQPGLMLCLLLAAWLGVEVYLISEPYSPGSDNYLTNKGKWLGKLKALLRPLLYRVYVLLLRHRISGIFAISQLAVAQYHRAGMPTRKLFPFGYFVPSSGVLTKPPELFKKASNDGLRIVFVGSLIQRKGLDLLHAAAIRLCEQGCVLDVDIYGPGDASSLMGNGSRLRYCGTIPFGGAQSIIAQYDLLILPSRFDGWGVVVNEALCAGVPVLCSDAAGAGNVAKTFGAGLSFASGDAKALSDVLLRLVRDPSRLQLMRVAASRLAILLQPDVAARYMLEVIQAPTDSKASVRSPWYPDYLYMDKP